MDTPIKTISVKLQNRSYDILIGKSILNQINNAIDSLVPDKLAVIISRRVDRLYSDYVKKAFKGYNNYEIILMNDGEEFKCYRYAEEFFNILLKKGYSRKSAIVSIGGGVVGDFSGFLASFYMRGIPIIHIPTTLLAMIDSSIGGKVAVNIEAGKNIVGSFHQPEIVISDISFLKTLPDNELKNGLTETVKHALIGASEILDILLNNDIDSIKNDKVIKEIIYLSAKFKSSIVEKDEREAGLRAILNFGHTVGHAIESLSRYKGISHGEAVAIGIIIELEMSRYRGFISEEDVIIYSEIVERYNLIYSDYRLDADELMNHMRYDKKN